MKTVIKTTDEIAELAARQAESILKNKQNAVFCFTPDEALKPLYARLAAMCGSGEISFKNAKAFVTCEFEGVDADISGSAHSFMEKNFFSLIDMPKESIHYPCTCGDTAELNKYDEEIAAAGGLDLAVVGIGKNGSIGFNEPATPFDSYTHTQLLTDATKNSLANAFEGAENVPEKGVTMGIKTITNAKSVIMLAFGEEKADIIYKMIYGKTVTYVPASMLQLHLDMTLYLDEDAGAKLK